MLLSFSCAIPSPSAHVLLNQPITLPVFYTISSSQYRTWGLQTLYLDNTYLHCLYCCICYIFTSNFWHTHLHSSLASIISFYLMRHQNGKEERGVDMPLSHRSTLWREDLSSTNWFARTWGLSNVEHSTPWLSPSAFCTASTKWRDSFSSLSWKPWHMIIHGELQRFGKHWQVTSCTFQLEYDTNQV